MCPHPLSPQLHPRTRHEPAGGGLDPHMHACSAPLELRIFLDGSCIEIFTGRCLGAGKAMGLRMLWRGRRAADGAPGASCWALPACPHDACSWSRASQSMPWQAAAMHMNGTDRASVWWVFSPCVAGTPACICVCRQRPGADNARVPTPEQRRWRGDQCAACVRDGLRMEHPT